MWDRNRSVYKSKKYVAMHLEGALLLGKKYSRQPRIGDLCKTMSAVDMYGLECCEGWNTLTTMPSPVYNNLLLNT